MASDANGHAPGSILGTRVRRTEDPTLLRGQARYLADLPLPGKLHVAFVRSEVAHGVIRGIDTSAAVGMPGVVAVWTAADIDLPPHQGIVTVHDDFARPALAVERVRFVGEPVAAVLAESAAEALDAAEAVVVDIDTLPAVVDAEAALAPDAPVLFPAHGSNTALVLPDPTEVDLEAISDVVVRGRFVNQRMAVVSLEPDGCAAAPDGQGRITIWASTQMPHMLQPMLGAALGCDPSTFHIVTPQVGGGFGGKVGLHCEFVLVAYAARRLGRPVIWVPWRSEDLRTMPHSRGQVQYAELGLRNDGTFTGLRVRLVGDAGAYPGIGTMLPAGTKSMGQGTYAIPAVRFEVAVSANNTTPMGAYRGAGRPEATALIERIVDQAAHETGIDPIELRLANFVPAGAFPFTTVTGLVYDSGDYGLPLRRAAEVVGYEALRAEQRARRERGDTRLLGIGVASYVEITAGGATSEFAAVDVHEDGSATVRAGTSAHGQGHQTSYAMIVSDATGIPIERIRLVDGDTDLVPHGIGTGGSRSLQLAGSAVLRASEVLVDTARTLAASMLEADPADVVVDTATGTVGVAGVPSKAFSWGQLAVEYARRAAAADGADGGSGVLGAQFDFSQVDATFPFGAHISVVEVDVETGRVTVVRHVAVDDCGTVLNPMIVEGQQHGGVAAGIGQALYEEVRHDADGNPLNLSLAEYAVVSAPELPSLEVHSTQTPTPYNPLGAKGIGEAATIGSTPAVQNAVIDALAHLGVRHIDMPCTPERVWRAVRDARAGTLASPWSEPPAVFADVVAAAAAAAAGGDGGDAAAAAHGV
jgi:carbon-monoxide dehydrogenase large subunit